MTTDTISWGETYDIALTAQDSDGAAVAIDATWAAACRITKDRIGGTIIAEPAMSIAGGQASCTLDTGDEGWGPGVYYYDIRLTDPDGNDYWTATIKLKLLDRNAPASPAPIP
jgi:hypothetical protein